VQDDASELHHGPLEPQEDLIRHVWELERHHRGLEREEVDLLSQDVHIEGGGGVDLDRHDKFLGPVGGDLARLDDDCTGAVR
jgi:hypothetical protein